MNLRFNTSILKDYHSSSQIARVLTESWVTENMFCPRCGTLHIKHFTNNLPVADFFCPHCNSEYELKSKNGPLGEKVNDGAYETMIQRITSNKNPDFFFMSYSKKDYTVSDFVFIPKHFFVPEIIEKRKPLSEAARRAGWIGCNILINQISEQGRIPIIENGKPNSIELIVEKVTQSDKLKINNIASRGWLLDVLICINKIQTKEFTLNEAYSFEHALSILHPDNANIKPKIRQQLQFLRDKGFINFLGNGKYIKNF